MLSLLVALPVAAQPGDESNDSTVSLLGDLEGAQMVVLSPGEEYAAAVFPDAGKKNRSIVRLAASGGDTALNIELSGEIRSMLFDRSTGRWLAVLHRAAKRKPAATLLFFIDPATGKNGRILTLPATASAMAFGPGGSSVLFACEDEIRSYLLPDFRSGPLYRLLGSNTALLALPGTERILVGKPDGILLVDLGDRHGKEEMPHHRVVETASPVTAMALGSDGSTAMAWLQEGDPLSMQLGPMARKPAKPAPEPEAVTEPAATEEPEPTPAPVQEPKPEPEQVQEPEPEPEPVPEPAVVKEIASEPEPIPEPEKEPVREPEPAPAPAQEPEPEPVPEPAEEIEEDGGALRGSLTGPEAGEVEWVVLLGPNNLIREAKRVQPGSDGRWNAGGLEPGRYRVVLDAGGNRVAISSPGFRMAVVEEGKRTTVPPFEVVGVR